MIRFFVFLVFLSVSYAAKAGVVTVCNVGSGKTTRVEVVREAPIADTYIYFLRERGKSTPIFGDRESSRGAFVKISCVGSKMRSLVLSGEFGANALQGFAITYRPEYRQLGRLDFAEKSRPKWLLLSKDETIVVIPTDGLGEISKKYVAYRNRTGSRDEPTTIGVDHVPELVGYEKVELKTLVN